MKLVTVEAELRRAITITSSERAEAVEGLVAALLSGALGFSPRATDGFVPIHEEIDATIYLVIGKVYMIEDQSTQPVSLNLVLTDGTGIVSGTLRLGVRSGSGWGENGSRLENALGYPQEMVGTFNWAHVFERRSDGWILQDSESEES